MTESGEKGGSATIGRIVAETRGRVRMDSELMKRTTGVTKLTEVERNCRRHLASLDGDVAHDLDHVLRVVANATAIARAERADVRVVVPAAWLHDCVSVPKNSPDRSKASARSAEEAVRLLDEWGFGDLPLNAIQHAIAAHSFSADIRAESLEACVLQDADRLDALGAIGLARCLMLGGALQRPLYCASDPFCSERQPDDLAATVDHFYTKLLHLSGRFNTATGRGEAARRTAVLERFLADLKHELAWASEKRSSGSRHGLAK